MALIAVAADKGAPGVTTTAIALAAVWPRPVLLAECDPAGGDVAGRLPAGDPGSRLDPQRGLLSMAVATRRGMRPDQVWHHTQKLRGGLDVLLGTTHAEQGSGLGPLWDSVGAALAGLPRADVIADCGRTGPDGPFCDLLAHAAAIVLVTRASLAEVLRLRQRAAAVAQAVHRRTGRPGRVGVLVIADHRGLREALAEVGQAVAPDGGPVSILGGIAFDPRSAEALRGRWGGKLDRSLFIRTVREVAAHLAGPWWLPDPGFGPGAEPGRPAGPALPGRTARHAAPGHAAPDHAAPGHAVPGHAAPDHAAPGHAVPGHAAPGGRPAGRPRPGPPWGSDRGPAVPPGTGLVTGPAAAPGGW